ncbi:hypothetical protein Tco_0510370, partial [Tanacetum coccineum]
MFGEELCIGVVVVGVDDCCGDDEVEEMGVGVLEGFDMEGGGEGYEWNSCEI